MATVSITISRLDFTELTRRILGMRMTRPWYGYANALFAECGKLHEEMQPITRKDGSVKKRIEGQAEFMLDCHWRLEQKRTVAFGRDSSNRKLASALKWLKSRKITDIRLEGDIPELVVELDGQYRLRSFMSYEGSSSWVVFLRDEKLFPRPKQWTKKWLNRDHGLWLHYYHGRLECELGY